MEKFLNSHPPPFFAFKNFKERRLHIVFPPSFLNKKSEWEQICSLAFFRALPHSNKSYHIGQTPCASLHPLKNANIRSLFSSKFHNKQGNIAPIFGFSLL